MHESGQNFRAETDTDGVHVVTWDMPGHSMNVIGPRYRPPALPLDMARTTRGPKEAFYRRFPPTPAAA